jgi:hypothetical protein
MEGSEPQFVEDAGLKRCDACGRTGAPRGFHRVVQVHPKPDKWFCNNFKACQNRQKRLSEAGEESGVATGAKTLPSVERDQGYPQPASESRVIEAARAAVAAYPFPASPTSDIDWYMMALRDALDA